MTYFALRNQLLGLSENAKSVDIFSSDWEFDEVSSASQSIV